MADKIAKLTPMQVKVWIAFQEHEEEGKGPPTLRELCKRFGWASSGSARDHVAALVRKGVLRSNVKGRRGAVLPPAMTRIPLVDTKLGRAGKMVVAGEYPLPLSQLPDGEAFALNVVDSAMSGDGILEDDIVVVDASHDAQPGDLAVVELKRQLRVRRLGLRSGQIVAASSSLAGRPHVVPVLKSAVCGRVFSLARFFVET